MSGSRPSHLIPQSRTAGSSHHQSSAVQRLIPGLSSVTTINALQRPAITYSVIATAMNLPVHCLTTQKSMGRAGSGTSTLLNTDLVIYLKIFVLEPTLPSSPLAFHISGHWVLFQHELDEGRAFKRLYGTWLYDITFDIFCQMCRITAVEKRDV